MKDQQYFFPDVTLLITHYNRSLSLLTLLQSFKVLEISFGEIIVSDDGSTIDHLKEIKKSQTEFGFRLIESPINKGLGNNINKGQDVVKTSFTLYVQEDFVVKDEFPSVFTDAVEILKSHSEIDIIRFYAYFKFPYTQKFGKGFSEMKFKVMPWFSDHLKFYLYSDHPHLRRSDLFQKFGRYPENLKGDDTEFTMALSFLKNKGRGLLYDHFTKVFDQVNTSIEPSTMKRSDWKQKNNLFILLLRRMYLPYRLLKNTLQYFKHKPKR